MGMRAYLAKVCREEDDQVVFWLVVDGNEHCAPRAAASEWVVPVEQTDETLAKAVKGMVLTNPPKQTRAPESVPAPAAAVARTAATTAPRPARAPAAAATAAPSSEAAPKQPAEISFPDELPVETAQEEEQQQAMHRVPIVTLT